MVGVYSRLSLSARRAWIEIREQFKYVVQCRVALRKESVDRNVFALLAVGAMLGVALRKESVDRNLTFPPIWTLTMRRSPQGERG